MHPSEWIRLVEQSTIGNRIREARKKAGLTQRQLGDRLGGSGGMIGRYESGTRNPKLETAERIASALRIDVNWLLHGQTLEDRDNAMKESAAVRFTVAEIQIQMDKLDSEGLKKVADYVDLLPISGRCDRQPVTVNNTLTVYGDGPAGNFPPKPEEDG